MTSEEENSQYKVWPTVTGFQSVSFSFILDQQ